jgi:hypothetical protein
MSRPKASVGTFARVEAWFKNHAGVIVNAREVAKELDITPVQAARAIRWLRKNRPLTSGTLKGTYAWPTPLTVRPTFKVAKGPVPPFQKIVKAEPEPEPVTVKVAHPIIAERFRNYWITGRVQLLDTNTAILWNSSAQRQELGRAAYQFHRQNAFG